MKKEAKQYVNVFYETIKNLFEEYSYCFSADDITRLFDEGYINQPQLEELMTIISPAEYEFCNFDNKDNGYFRQPGPLSQQQIFNDVIVNHASKKR